MDEKQSILIVDDDESTCRTLGLIFGKKDYEIETARMGQEAMEKVQKRFFNLALLDIKLPDIEGTKLLSSLKEIHPDMEVIIITAYASLKTAVQALNKGASAYITKPLNMDEVLATIREALKKQHLMIENRRLLKVAQQGFERLQKVLEGTIHVIGLIVEKKDPYIIGHQQRVSHLACAIATEMGLSQKQIEAIRIAASIHDIGKVATPLEILAKPAPLSDLEFSLIKNHPQIAYEIIKDIEFPWPVAKIILQHHERIDGSGYPQGLKEDEIILEARILAVADVVEAVSSHRPYRDALGIEKALEEISHNKGTLYDPQVVDACVRLFTEKGFKL